MQVARILSVIFGLAMLIGALPVRAYKVNPDTQSVTIVSLADFDKCANQFGDGDACLEGLKAYVQKQPKEAFGAGKHARLQFQHWTALPFFAKAFAKGPSAEQCSDPDVSMAVISGLALPSDHPVLATARKIASEQCWPQLQAAVVAQFGESGGGYYSANTCPIAADKKLVVEACKPQVAAKPVPDNTVVNAVKGVDWKTLAIDPATARLLRGRNGEEVYLAKTKPGARDLVLLKFKAIPGAWNGQVFVAVERDRGHGDKEYVTWVENGEWNALIERSGSVEAFVKGANESIPLYAVAIDRGQKREPTLADVTGEFSGGAKPAAAPAKTPAKK